MKSFMRFGKKVKPIPRYICPYRMIKSIHNVTYELEQPPRVSSDPSCISHFHVEEVYG